MRPVDTEAAFPRSYATIPPSLILESHLVPAIYLAHLSLANFRNYERLELDLQPGITLVHGGNGQGKSNLLEAVYLLAIAKSPRASADREMVRQQSAAEGYARVSATVMRGSELLRAEVDFVASGGGGQAPVDGHSPGSSVEKLVKINGVTRRAIDLVGQVNAVLFTAHDLELVYGPPTVRRRYLDILISQVDQGYLRALQKYQRVLYQRNHLLKLVRDRRAAVSELDFWDDELATGAAIVMSSRMSTVDTLSSLGADFHRELTDQGEELELRYVMSVPVATGGSTEELERAVRESVLSAREKEISRGVTVVGPHRDDMEVLIDGVDIAAYASRGQARTAVLAMKLAEARHLANIRTQEPILLLDDVLSELDSARRSRVLTRATQYEQCLVTTTDLESIDESFRRRSHVMRVRDDVVKNVGADTGSDSASG